MQLNNCIAILKYSYITAIVKQNVVDFQQKIDYSCYMTTEFWNRINSLIKEKKMTQETLSEVAGVKYQTLRNWSARDIFPQAPEAVRIASALGVSVEYLVTGDNPKDHATEKLSDVISHAEEILRIAKG